MSNFEPTSTFEIDVQIDEEYAALVNGENLRAAALATLTLSGLNEAELTVVVTSDAAVQELNRDYRGVNAPTDVLSFAAQEEDAQHNLALPPELAVELDRYLGDIIIAYPYTMHQAEHFGNRPDAELRLMVIHGVLHLLGDDHDTPEAEAAMWARQEAVLAHFGDPSVAQRHYATDDKVMHDQEAHD